MKNRILFFLSLFVFSLSLSAQSIRLQSLPGTVSFIPSGFFVETGLTVVNQADSAVRIMAERVSNDLNGMQESYFCWDVCYGVDTDRSFGALQIQPGDSTDAFTLYFDPIGESADASVTMRFFNRDDTTDFVEHTFHFSANATSIERAIPAQEALSPPFPNPAKVHTRFRYHLPSRTEKAELRIYNLIGRKVAHFMLEPNKDEFTLYTDRLQPGIHLAYLIADGKEVSSRKLVVVK
jgi:hypothetical protein